MMDRLRIAQRGLIGLEVGLLGRIVDFDEQGPLLNVLRGFELDGAHDAADLRGDLDALRGAQRADGGERRRPGLGFGLCGGDGTRRLAGLLDEAFDHGRLHDHLEITEPAGRAEQDDQSQDDDNCAFHA